MSYVKISETLYYGIHPQRVSPNLQFDNYINLTEPKDFSSLPLPKPKGNWYSFPIKDRGAPTLEYLTEIVNFILKLHSLNESVYIFCKGGHGRSGTVMASVYGKINNLNGVEAMNHIDKEWRSQRDMSFLRPQIIKLGSPQTNCEETNCEEIFRIIIFFKKLFSKF